MEKRMSNTVGPKRLREREREEGKRGSVLRRLSTHKELGSQRINQFLEVVERLLKYTKLL
jgi:hypothetical protein